MSDARLDALRAFAANVPHNRALGIVALAISEAEVVLELPYAEALVGDAARVIHGGAITALVDAASGAAVFASLPTLVPIATLDLRLDHLRAAEPGRAVRCRATCYRRTREVAFTRAVAYHDRDDEPIAHSVGTFMLGTRGAPP